MGRAPREERCGKGDRCCRGKVKQSHLFRPSNEEGCALCLFPMKP